MNWSESLARYQFVLSIPSAVLITCLAANDAASKTTDIPSDSAKTSKQVNEWETQPLLAVDIAPELALEVSNKFTPDGGSNKKRLSNTKKNPSLRFRAENEEVADKALRNYSLSTQRISLDRTAEIAEAPETVETAEMREGEGKQTTDGIGNLGATREFLSEDAPGQEDEIVRIPTPVSDGDLSNYAASLGPPLAVDVRDFSNLFHGNFSQFEVKDDEELAEVRDLLAGEVRAAGANFAMGRSRSVFDFYVPEAEHNFLGATACNYPDCYLLAQTPPPSRPNLPRGPLPPENPVPEPNRDRFLQPLPEPTQPEPPEIPSIDRTPPPQSLPEQPNAMLEVLKVEVAGSTILTLEEIDGIVGPLESRVVSLTELREAADTITEIYLERGYITSRAILPPQTVVEGVVKIEVLEGILGEIKVEGLKRLNSSYIKSRIRLGADRPLDTAKLENQLRLLRANPLFENVEASLRASEKPGESILIVRVTETNPFEASLNIDNYSPPSVGSERIGLTFLHRNLTGNGDLLVAAYNTTQFIADGDSNVFDFIYNFPINPMNGTIQVRFAPNENSITQAEFQEFNITGETSAYEISYRQPILRNPIQEFALSLGLSYQKSDTFVNGDSFGFGAGRGENDGTNSSTVIKFGQDYLRRDARGVWALRSQFNLGVDLFDATVKNDPIPDGRFFSWQGQVQRVQKLSSNHLLILQGDVQFSTTALLPYQQFIIGGGLSVRGYRQNSRSGDNGFRFSIEDRITIERDESGFPTIQFAPFLDFGAVWNNGSNPNNEFLPSQRFLIGTGMGVIWQPLPQLNVRLDYGIPLIDLDDRGNNAQDSGFYFSVIFRP